MPKIRKLRLLSCILVVGVIVALVIPKAFSWNPIETIFNTYNLIVNYQ
jgi:hypothetical protein